MVLTAALSVYNSCVYCNSRMLFGSAQQGNAPRALLRVNHRGIPLTARRYPPSPRRFACD